MGRTKQLLEWRLAVRHFRDTETTGCVARVTGAWGRGCLGSGVSATSHWALGPRRVFVSRYCCIRVNNTVIAKVLHLPKTYQLVSAIESTRTYLVLRREFTASSPLHSSAGYTKYDLANITSPNRRCPQVGAAKAGAAPTVPSTLSRRGTPATSSSTNTPVCSESNGPCVTLRAFAFLSSYVHACYCLSVSIVSSSMCLVK